MDIVTATPPQMTERQAEVWESVQTYLRKNPDSSEHEAVTELGISTSTFYLSKRIAIAQGLFTPAKGIVRLVPRQRTANDEFDILRTICAELAGLDPITQLRILGAAEVLITEAGDENEE